MRAIGLLTAACFAVSATFTAAQTVPQDDTLQTAPAASMIDTVEPPAAPGTPGAPAPATPAEPKYKVAKELLDKVNAFAGHGEFPKALAAINDALAIALTGMAVPGDGLKMRSFVGSLAASKPIVAQLSFAGGNRGEAMSIGRFFTSSGSAP